MLTKLYIGGSRSLHYVISAFPAILGAVFFALTMVGALRIKWYFGAMYFMILAAVSASMAFMPKFKISSMLEQLELRLPHLVLRLRTLIMAGESPLDAFISAAREVKSPILDLIIKEISLGRTPEEALNEVKQIFGNKPIFDALKRIILSLGMGEEAINYLREEFEGLMSDRESSLRKAIESLSVIVEMYMSMGVFFPVVAIVMLASLSILGTGINVNILIALLIFIAIPLFSMFSTIMAKKIIERALL